MASEGDKATSGQPLSPELQALWFEYKLADPYCCLAWHVRRPELDEAFRTGQKLDHLPWCCRNQSPLMLSDAVGLDVLTDEAFREAVFDAWCSAEFPGAALPRSRWIQFFSRAGFIIDGKSAPRPAEPMVIYRGATWGRRRGMSWTADPDMARWFATYRDKMFNREPGTSHVFKAVVQSSVILALFRDDDAGRAESEVVVNPSLLPSLPRSAIAE